MKSLSFSLMLALGLCSTAFAYAEKSLPLNETGCIDQPLKVKRGEVYSFKVTEGNGLMLSFAPVSPNVVVKDPKGKRVALEVGADGDTPEDRFSFAEIDQKGRYTSASRARARLIPCASTPPIRINIKPHHT